ncbi:MAG TPA: bifunctional hydroxymethylpyrimidine kinase/phosphomethylpyrimidine kinase [Patescibacteria group bacterium]|nr:bifunctional hydroxymethylpyrimidine kinase/phosphomethylpyrimidine kinase [Patescibacteria group bacterium]
MKREKQLRHFPIALTIAGSDSGGGAGIQADLKTFAALGIHGTTAITCVTAQNPRRVLAINACDAAVVRAQLGALFEELPPAAVKTGMLYSAGAVRAVADFLKGRRLPLVVDPVMISTSGARLLQPEARRVLSSRLLPLATLITPNLQEAEALLGSRIKSVEDLRRAARALHQKFGTAALVKGGHLNGLREAVDIFYDGKDELLLSAPFVRGVKTHGTGCTYSAAITAYLAKGNSLGTAVSKAKEFVTQSIAQSLTVAGYDVLNSFWASL